MIKELAVNMRLAIVDGDHFTRLMDGLCSEIKDQHLDGSFDCFAFAWELLPLWAKALVLSVAYRENRPVFTGIKPETPIALFTDQQRHVLSLACEKMLTAIVILMADYDFTEDFYKGWRDGRSQALLNQNPQEKPHVATC